MGAGLQLPANPVFRGIQDWLTNSLERPQGDDYGIDFTPPGNPDVTDDDDRPEQGRQGGEQPQDQQPQGDRGDQGGRGR